MGLKDYRRYKKEMMVKAAIKDFLHDNDITIDELKSVKSLKAEVNSLKEENKSLREEIKKLTPVDKPFVLSEEEKNKIVEDAKGKTSIQDIVDMYKGDNQEFYPHGKREA